MLTPMAELGPERGKDGLQVYAMCEIPNNGVLVARFAPLFDGLHRLQRPDPADPRGRPGQRARRLRLRRARRRGEELTALAVEGCRRSGIHSGICGQTPSDHPDMVEFLVRIGIDSMSLNPDSVVATTARVLGVEATTPAARSGRSSRPVVTLIEELAHPGG